MSIHIQVPPTSCHNFISLYVSLCKPQRCLSSGLSVSTVVLLSAISTRWFSYRFEVHGISETFPERALPHFRNLVAALSCIISACSTRLFCASSGTGLPTSLELPRELIVLGQSQGNQGSQPSKPSVQRPKLVQILLFKSSTVRLNL